MLIYIIVKQDQSCNVLHEQINPTECYHIETNCKDERTSPSMKCEHAKT